MKRSSLTLALSLAAVVMLCAIDSFTKRLAQALLKGSEDVVIIPKVLVLRYVENTGAAFGLFKGMVWLFVILTVIVCLYIVSTLMRMSSDRRYLPVRLVLIALMAGAIGNFLDRIRLGYVVDFIYFELIDFPVFNVADIYVTVSIAVLLVLMIFYYREEDFDAISGRKALKD